MKLQFDDQLLKSGAGVLLVINNPFRQEIIQVQHKKGRINVTEMYETLHWDQLTTSQHLKILRQERLVHSKRENREAYYTLNCERFAAVDKLVKGIVRI